FLIFSRSTIPHDRWLIRHYRGGTRFRMRYLRPFSLICGPAAAAAVILAVFFGWIDRAAGQDDPGAQVKEACQKNLQTIHQALEAYRVDHKDVPNWLSDLVPKYLPNPNVLTCPNARETGQIVNHGIVDPGIAT